MASRSSSPRASCLKFATKAGGHLAAQLQSLGQPVQLRLSRLLLAGV
jgi:hypothetical protein